MIMYRVHQDLISAVAYAMLEATERGQQQTIYTPVSGGDFYLVGNTAEATDMVNAGCLALFTVNSHCPPCFRPAMPMGESMRCWEDLEEEAARD